MYSCVLGVIECAIKISYCVMEDFCATMYSVPYIMLIARYASHYRLLFVFAFVISVLRLYGHYATMYINCVYIVSLISSVSYVVSYHIVLFPYFHCILMWLVIFVALIILYYLRCPYCSVNGLF